MLKRIITTMILILSLSSFGQGVINGYDNVATRNFNNVKIYNNNGSVIGEAIISYDLFSNCINNIKYFNYQNINGYIRLKLSVGGFIYFNNLIRVSPNQYTYINNAFSHCSSTKYGIGVNITN